MNDDVRSHNQNFRETKNQKDFQSSMNPIGHATKGSNNKIINGKTSTYGKKLGTSNNIFVSDHAKDPMTESPTKK